MGDLKAQPQTILKTDLSEGYKDTEIGSLPEDWEVVRLEEVATFVMGQSPSSDTYNISGSGLPFLQGKAEFGDVYPQPVKWCSSPLKVIPEGAILVSVRAPVGDVNIAPYKCCIGRGLAAIQPTTEADTKYLFYCLGFHKNRFEEQSSGSTFKSINKGVLKNFLTPLPPLHEQKAIAHVLSTVQKAIQTTEQVIEASRELKRSLMTHLFTYGPVPVDEAEQVPLKESEIGPVPEHWKVVRLAELLREGLRNGHSARATNTDEGVRTLTLSAVTQNDFSIERTKLTIADPKKVAGLWLQAGDLLIERANTVEFVGLAALYDGPDHFAIYPDLMVRVRVNEELINPKLVAEFLLMKQSRSYFRFNARGTAGNMPKIDHGTIQNALIPLPPTSEQEQIVHTVWAMDRKIAAERTRKDSLDALFRTLLNNLMTGKVRVDNLDLSEVEEMT